MKGFDIMRLLTCSENVDCFEAMGFEVEWDSEFYINKEFDNKINIFTLLVNAIEFSIKEEFYFEDVSSLYEKYDDYIYDLAHSNPREPVMSFIEFCSSQGLEKLLAITGCEIEEDDEIEED